MSACEPAIEIHRKPAWLRLPRGLRFVRLYRIPGRDWVVVTRDHHGAMTRWKLFP